jgi:hypothetical protein
MPQKTQNTGRQGQPKGQVTCWPPFFLVPTSGGLVLERKGDDAQRWPVDVVFRNLVANACMLFLAEHKGRQACLNLPEFVDELPIRNDPQHAAEQIRFFGEFHGCLSRWPHASDEKAFRTHMTLWALEQLRLACAALGQKTLTRMSVARLIDSAFVKAGVGHQIGEHAIEMRATRFHQDVKRSKIGELMALVLRDVLSRGPYFPDETIRPGLTRTK